MNDSIMGFALREALITVERFLKRIQELEAERTAIRTSTIEECAKVADTIDPNAESVADAIRALNKLSENIEPGFHNCTSERNVSGFVFKGGNN